jgi:hypothetical protein
MRELHLRIGPDAGIEDYRILAECQEDELIVRTALERSWKKKTRVGQHPGRILKPTTI